MQISEIGMGGLGSVEARSIETGELKKSEAFARTLKEIEARELSADEEAKKAKDKKLREACEGFEAMFMQMMYRQMRKTVPENSLFGESHGEKIFQDMLDTEMIDRMSSVGGVGLGDMIYQQLVAQEKARADMQEKIKEKMTVDIKG